MSIHMSISIFSKISPIKVIDASIHISDYIPIDISKENKELLTFDIASSTEWEIYLERYLKKNNAKVAYGGYLETRDIYNRSTHFDDGIQRNIHLGIDLWTNSDTKVLAALEGTIHSLHNNANYGDYGPTIIIKHSIDSFTFYTLYGHLSLKSLVNVKVGERIKQGDVIGYLGSSSVNGDYAPHLHFQLIIDIANYHGDYPGVCAVNELDFFKENCPDPNLLLKINL
ncbi:MAG: peptidoglycan DD-metalloendopeptidase family protein [Flavobacteriaceae bacterium]